MTVYLLASQKQQWEQYNQKWKNCQLCPLSQTRHKVVLFRGNLNCKFLFVGEAPGEAEDIFGSPFVGIVGDEFDDLLDTVLSSFPSHVANQYGITNTLGCIPIHEGSIKAPSSKELKACAPRLIDLLAICNPKLVVCLGRVADKTVPASTNYTKIHLTHPSAHLRAPTITDATLMRKRFILGLTAALENLYGSPS